VPLAVRWNLARREGWRGELQNLRPRRDAKHDAAPFAVEACEDGIHSALGTLTLELHRQAAERAVRMRSVGVHAPSHRLIWLIDS